MQSQRRIHSHISWLLIRKSECNSFRSALLLELDSLTEKLDVAFAAHAEVHAEESNIGLSLSEDRRDQLSEQSQRLLEEIVWLDSKVQGMRMELELLEGEVEMLEEDIDWWRMELRREERRDERREETRREERSRERREERWWAKYRVEEYDSGGEEADGGLVGNRMAG